jgi:SAM-dependent methyltransferase
MKKFKYPAVTVNSPDGCDMWLYDVVWCRSHGDSEIEAKDKLDVAFAYMYDFFSNVLRIKMPVASVVSAVLADDREQISEIVFTVADAESETIRYQGFVSAVDSFRKCTGVFKDTGNNKLSSQICRPSDMPKFEQWLKALEPNQFSSIVAPPRYQHRKWWEFCYIVQVLHERGMLMEGKRGLGFAVGKEPLPALFASMGATVVATDIDISTDTAKGWFSGGMNTGNDVSALHYPGICDAQTFGENVSFRPADMNNIGDDLNGFDFCWSSCAFEHLGSINNGEQFLYNMVRTLKPGGIAVHTTEINISSNGRTVETGNSVIFRKRDFEKFASNLGNMGCEVEPLDFRLDGTDLDNVIDFPPYDSVSDMLKLFNFNQLPHFKLVIGGYVSTSFGIIIRKKN